MSVFHPSFSIGTRPVGAGAPCYVIAEISCNHEGNIDEARAIITAAAKAGVDAVKLQTYTADTISRNFGLKPKGTMWEDSDLYALYQKAQTPWAWTRELKKFAEDQGLQLFSSPFDETAVDFLVDEIGVPALKIASFEAVDTKLIEKVAKTGLPVLLSNGMTDFLEMDEAVRMLRQHGCKDLALLHCNSGYPADFAEANLKTMQAMAQIYGCVVGLSDHTLFADPKSCTQPMAHVTPLEAVRLGAKIIEIHVMMDRGVARALFEKNTGGFDWPFSREPAELETMVRMIRTYERTGTIDYETQNEREVAARTHGTVFFEPTERERSSRTLRPSLWVVRDMRPGDLFRFGAEDKAGGNFDSVRPAGGLHIRYTDLIDGCTATCSIKAGEALTWDMVDLSTKQKSGHDSRNHQLRFG